MLPSYEEYKYHVGVIAGLNMALSLIDEATTAAHTGS